MSNLIFKEKIFVTRPLLPPLKEYQKKLEEIWDNQWLTNYGPLEHEFQTSLKNLFNAKNVELFSNGHTSLDLVLKALKNFGITPDKEEVRFLGKNGKMNEFEAKKELCNLNNLEHVIHERFLIYNHYLECLEDLEDAGDLKVISPQKNVEYNYAYFTIKLNGIE